MPLAIACSRARSALRTQVVLAEGGSKYTEAAVAQGLRWLSRHQADDGHWSLQHFDRHGDCNGRCDGQGHGTQNVGATGLALLPFLGAAKRTRAEYTRIRSLAASLAHRSAKERRKPDPPPLSNNVRARHRVDRAVRAVRTDARPRLEKPAQKAVDFIVRAAQRFRSGSRRRHRWLAIPTRRAGRHQRRRLAIDGIAQRTDWRTSRAVGHV